MTARPSSSADRPSGRDAPALERLIVTIDGPAGTGKSSVARGLARRLGVEFLDTGAMYRAAAAIALDRSFTPTDHSAIVDAVAEADLHFDWTMDPPAILGNGVSLMDRLRRADVTAIVSPIAAIPGLRRLMVREQRIIAEQHPRLVTEGRDQGSVVFPDADIKIYLDASPRVRARRRAEQTRAAGQSVDEQSLYREIVERDRSDASRREGPLTCPDDAERVDTSDLTFEQVVEKLESIVAQRLAVRVKKKGRGLYAGHA